MNEAKLIAEDVQRIAGYANVHMLSPGRVCVSDDEFANRTKVLIDRAGGVEPLARKAGVSPRVLRKYRDGEADPSRERMVALARAAGVSIEWLATGEGPMLRREALAERDRAPIAQEGPPGDGYVALPRYDVHAAAGVGVPVITEEIADYIYFRADWLRRTLGLSPSQLALIEAVGDSMNPTIRDGDLLLLDVSEPKMRGDGVYVIGEGDALLVKRVSVKLGGRGLSIRSDNERYSHSDLELGQEELGTIRIVGRVVWVGGRV